MNTVLAVIVSLVFVALALWHFRMALLPSGGLSGAVPSESGKPLFVPSVRATLAVGVVLLVFAFLVAATAGLVEVGFRYACCLGLRWHWVCWHARSASSSTSASSSVCAAAGSHASTRCCTRLYVCCSRSA